VAFDPTRVSQLESVLPCLYWVADRSWLPRDVLLRLLSDLGAPESAAAEVLSRLRTDGTLIAERRGREIDYALAGLARRAFRQTRGALDPTRSDKPKPPPAWKGAFDGLLIAVPAAERPARDRLRRAARMAGYAPLRPGLMIGVRNRWTALAEVVGDLPASASVSPVTLGLKTDDARRAAADAWRLDRASRRLHAQADRLEAAAAAPGFGSGAAALSGYVVLVLPVYRLFVRVPPLPSELLPSDWPVDRLVAAVGTVRHGLGAAAATYVDELLSHER
jgi:phenylacetic acid degradation operon negative regulatory protein